MRFSKYHGTGNDFIVIAGHAKQVLPDEIKRLCRRRYGIGADGLIFVQPKADAAAAVSVFNADGKEAEMCGNGLRCVAQFLLDHGCKKKELTLFVGAKRYLIRIEGQDILIDMGIPFIIEEGTLNGLSYLHINSGTSHFIHFCEDLCRSDFGQIAQNLRYHKHFSPSGVNINFVKLFPSRLLQMRTYERGVEGETPSCGTGAAAACVAAWKKFGIQGEIEVEFHSQERLQFDLLAKDGLLKGLVMRGRAIGVYQGELKV